MDQNKPEEKVNTKHRILPTALLTILLFFVFALGITVGYSVQKNSSNVSKNASMLSTKTTISSSPTPTTTQIESSTYLDYVDSYFSVKYPSDMIAKVESQKHPVNKEDSHIVTFNSHTETLVITRNYYSDGTGGCSIPNEKPEQITISGLKAMRNLDRDFKADSQDCTDPIGYTITINKEDNKNMKYSYKIQYFKKEGATFKDLSRVNQLESSLVFKQ